MPGELAIDIVDAYAAADDQLAALESLDRRASQPETVI